MRHRVHKVRLNRSKQHLDSMLRNLATSVILYEKVKTTQAKAKALKPIVERLIHQARTMMPTNAYRELNAYLVHKNASQKVMEELKERYKDRSSGYLRIVSLGYRAGDSAPMVQLSFV